MRWRSRGMAAVCGVLLAAAAGAGTPAHAACTGWSALLGTCRTATTTTTTPPPPPAPVPAPAPPPAPVAAPTLDLAAAGHQMLDLANVERAIAGAPALVMRDDAVAVAVEHGRRMADAGRIFHNDQLFSAPVRAALAAKTLGENVGYGGSVTQIHTALMASAGHRANILKPQFRVAGIGIVKSGSTMYMTQVFIEPSGAAPKPAPTPAARPPAATSKPKVARTTATRAPAPTTVPAPPTSEATTTTVAAPPDAPTTAAAVVRATEFAAGARVAPPEADSSTSAQALALALLTAVTAWVVRVRRRVDPRPPS